MAPPAGRRSPEMTRRVVLLPAPLAPSRATICPSGTLSEMPRRATMAPYEAWRSVTVSISLSQVGFDDARVVLHLLRRALGNLAAEVEDGDAVGDTHDERHVVLHQEHGDLEVSADVADERGEALELVVTESAGGLVEHQQAGAAGEGSGEFDALLDGERQGTGGIVAE